MKPKPRGITLFDHLSGSLNSAKSKKWESPAEPSPAPDLPVRILKKSEAYQEVAPIQPAESEVPEPPKKRSENSKKAPAARQGIQRLTASGESKPKRKNLTSLKKRLYLARAHQWHELMGSQTDVTAERGPFNFTEKPAVPRSSSAQNATDPSISVSQEISRESYNTAVDAPTSSVVCITGLVCEDDLLDDDEYEEILANVKDLAEQFGRLRQVIVPRDGPDVCKVMLEYVLSADACRAIDGMNGKVVSGNTLSAAAVYPNDNATTSHMSDVNDQPITSVVLVKYWVSAGELPDDDEFEEAYGDMLSVAAAYGTVVSLRVPRLEEEGCEVRIEYSQPSEATAAMCGLTGLVFGGATLEAAFQSSDSACFDEPAVERATAEAEAEDVFVNIIAKTHKCTPYMGKATAEQRKNLMRALEKKVKLQSRSVKQLRMQPKFQPMMGVPKLTLAIDGVQQSPVYVTHEKSPELDDAVYSMLQVLFRMQERQRLMNAAKAKAKRRLVVGLREVMRGLKSNSIKMVIAAPNINSGLLANVGDETPESVDPLDEKVDEILAAAGERDIPAVFALSRKKLGKALGKTIKVSIVGVYSFEGAHDARKRIERLIGQLVPIEKEEVEAAEVDCSEAHLSVASSAS